MSTTLTIVFGGSLVSCAVGDAPVVKARVGVGTDELHSIVLPTETLQWLHGKTSIHEAVHVQVCRHA